MEWLLILACVLTPVADEQREAVLQAVIDSPELAHYYHEGTHPERVPLVMLHNEHVPRTLHLKKFGKPVRILSEDEIRSEKVEAFLRVVSLEIEESQARVVAEYPIEGIRLTTTLKLVNDAWQAAETSLVEQ